MSSKQPLAFRMRPASIEEVAGQDHILGEGKMIARMVETRKLSSMILYGPPGTGKTSIASAIAGSTDIAFKKMNAVMNNKKDMELAVQEAKMSDQLIVIMDEVHRLDKTKQDFLLPYLESGLIIMIGATTANPYHAINPAIRSRTHIFEVLPLSVPEMKQLIERSLIDSQNGMGTYKTEITEEAKMHLAEAGGGDVRAALNALELAVLSTQPDSNGIIHITQAVAEECIQQKRFTHDKDGDHHYDVLSAFQKSIRGSDPDGALHYLARLIEAGDLTSIGRRLIVTAYEDIGLANPQAGPRALAAVEAAERLGFPEGRIPLADAVVELCLSPKSNSAYKALDAAREAMLKAGTPAIPPHLRDSHYKGADALGRGKGYEYPHNDERGWVPQQYLPDKLKNDQYYEPKDNSKFEKALADVYRQIKPARRKP
ncbi:replication-associated recombination protein A [Marinococcus halophilus]|uniref:Putative AAA domain-containing protein YrvN n=1 Tax=Marinococcus halophilus TaxID=1371 RepID=A0A510Y603_MARHA|nr:replication-associated recombination protein A [Marinococcus halophilus]OZT81091.1 replication-associated recombination protein A [Marinococcus halophilus]GEK58806.1 putative AAA domain-containing protein YrvN [Marinococcus halophilus]